MMEERRRYNAYDDAMTEPSSPLKSPHIAAASPYWSIPLEKPEEPSGFSPLVAFCFTINYILGTGFLTIPWAFVQGGLLLSTLCLVLAAFASDVAKDYLLESMALAEVMLDDHLCWKKANHDASLGRDWARPTETNGLVTASNNRAEKSYGGVTSTSPQYSHPIFHPSLPPTPTHSTLAGTPTLVPVENNRVLALPPIKRPSSSYYTVAERKYEVNTLCRVFLGRSGVKIFSLFICFYICGLLWAYTCVFASAMSRALPLLPHATPATNYLLYALVFGAIVVPLSCLEMDEQVPVQVFLTICRFVMLIFMLGTTALCAQETNITNTYDAAPWIRLEGLYKMLPIVVVANMYHHSIPGLSHPVADKRRLSSIFHSTTIFTTVAYSLVGCVLGSAFGTGVEQSSNLNWNGFHFGTGRFDEDTGELVEVAWWAQAIAMYIVCFPAIDVVSAFPLNAITLGNNMFGAVYGNRIRQVEDNRWLRTGFRLLASIPPIIFGIFVRELGVITDYTGTAGFVIGFSIPALLYIKSKAMARKKHYFTRTQYTSYGSFDSLAWLITCFGVGLVIFVLVSFSMGQG